MHTQEIKGDWTRAKEKLKARWEVLTDHDLQYVRGKMRNLIGRIQKRTGEDKETVEQAIEDATAEDSKKS